MLISACLVYERDQAELRAWYCSVAKSTSLRLAAVLRFCIHTIDLSYCLYCLHFIGHSSTISIVTASHSLQRFYTAQRPISLQFCCDASPYPAVFGFDSSHRLNGCSNAGAFHHELQAHFISLQEPMSGCENIPRLDRSRFSRLLRLH